MKVFMLFIGIVSLTSGVKLIYDARPIAKTYFSFNDKNVKINVVIYVEIFWLLLEHYY